MAQKLNYPLPIRIISLLLALSCGGATASWAAGADRSRPAVSRRPAPQAKPAPSLSGGPTVNDPCAPAAASVAAAHPAGRQAASRNPEPAAETRGPLARELWSSRITAPGVSEDAQTSLALKRLIRQVRGLALDDKRPAPPSAAPAESPTTAEPPKTATASTENVAPVPPEPVAAAAPETASPLAPKTLKTLEDLRKNAGRVRDPLEVAELLFLSGRPTDAVPFYEEALRRTSAGAAASGADRAWILFQLGNCLRETDATKAQDAYMKLIAEYPGSPWTEMARASGRLVAWYQNTRPDQLIAPPKP